MPTPTLTARIRRAAAWRPGARRGARITHLRCPFCKTMRPTRHFRFLGAGCRKCVGTG
ncbi:hypothetical protein Asp14428_45400 [Actinoplanes sp. NBRC 14428]|nr:hypothetical protein Asp14428_45400 [Actinoplanes sp. NBRC 14428]